MMWMMLSVGVNRLIVLLCVPKSALLKMTNFCLVKKDDMLAYRYT